jgi:hypothetical protein
VQGLVTPDDLHEEDVPRTIRRLPEWTVGPELQLDAIWRVTADNAPAHGLIPKREPVTAWIVRPDEAPPILL